MECNILRAKSGSCNGFRPADIGTPIGCNTSKIETLHDLYTIPLRAAGVGAGSGTSFYPRAVEALLRLKF